ncbi:MAG: cytochrome c-type biogenesis protein CcmH [Solirubrobacteraceae bacterium]
MRPGRRPPAPLLLLLVLCGALIGAPAAAPAAVAPAPRTTISAIEPQVMCVTCKIPLAEAQSAQASRERALISHLIADGLSETQVKRALVNEYGSAVLSLPSSSGFGLAVYIVPPIVVLVALAGILLALPRWRARGRMDDDAWGTGPQGTLTPAQAALLEADLARFERPGRPGH